MIETPHGEYRPCSVAPYQDKPRREDHRFGAANAVRALDLTMRRSPPWVALDAPLTVWVPDLPSPGQSALSRRIQRVATAIRLSRRRARSRQQLRQLSDHVLKDIGLNREAVGYEFLGPFWRFD